MAKGLQHLNAHQKFKSQQLRTTGENFFAIQPISKSPSKLQLPGLGLGGVSQIGQLLI